ncbi:uncharacterized protein [Rutidosis leptorrhynchoides]|uniref:uncharacterized protein n=1 Tax=Rutidosis leptorrhynchoides TaxID=125765 RepID=UPI003A999FB7
MGLLGELDSLRSLLDQVVLTPDVRDNWIWTSNKVEIYRVNETRHTIDDIILDSSLNLQQTKFNRSIPLKVNVLAWRVKRKRLPVLAELDNKGIDIDSVLCLNCTNMAESVDHCLVACSNAISIWNKVLRWWNINYNSFSTFEELVVLSPSGLNTKCKDIWNGIIWITAYYIWKNRNVKVFGKNVMISDAVL